MFAARLLGTSVRNACGKSILMNSNTLPSISTNGTAVIRSFRSVGNKFSIRNAKTRLTEVQAEAGQALKRKAGPMEVGQIAVAGGAALGLGALCYYGLGLSNEPGAMERMFIWPEYVRQRVQSTYLYFGASIGAVASSAYMLYKSPIGHRFFAYCTRHPIISTVGILVALVGTGQAMMSIPYTPGLGAKQLMWLVNCSMIGVAVAPIGVLGGAIAMRAAWYTAGIMGGLSMVAITAPSDKFLTWGGPLGIGLGGVLVASLGSAFFPPTSALGLSLYSISLYGGLLLFSAFLLYDTQKIVKKAETHPNYYGVSPYDPINASHHIVMDAVNIFVRLAQIFALGGGRRK